MEFSDTVDRNKATHIQKFSFTFDIHWYKWAETMVTRLTWIFDLVDICFQFGSPCFRIQIQS